jgi:hypothetical protein
MNHNVASNRSAPPSTAMTFLHSCVLLLLAWVTATGQPPAPVEPASKPAAPLGETKIVANIVEPKLDGKALATLYQKFTGRRVLVAAAAATAEFSFVYEASPQDPLTYAQAAELLRKSAGIEGFVFIPDDKDANLDFLTVAQPRGGCLGYDVYDENDVLPEGDGVVSYVMTFKHLKASEAAAIFTKRCDELGADPYSFIAALNASVVITEKLSVIRKLIELKQEIDKPEPRNAGLTK